MGAKPQAKAASTSSEAGKRPTKSWIHHNAKPLEELQVGDYVEGVVTNAKYLRVWVDAGFKKDVTFLALEEGQYKKGDRVERLKVSKVDIENLRVQAFIERSKDEIPKASKVAEKSAKS